MTVEKAEKPVRTVKSDVPEEVARLEFPRGDASVQRRER